MKLIPAALAAVLALCCVNAYATCRSLAQDHCIPTSDTQPAALSASSSLTIDSGFAVATLSNAGSFEFGLASMFTGVAMKAHLAETALKAHKITAAQAQARHDQLAAVKKLLDASLAACSQDNKTGACTGDKVQAVALEKKAKIAYAKLK